jgi:hypothetical protein
MLSIRAGVGNMFIINEMWLLFEDRNEKLRLYTSDTKNASLS